MEIIDNRRASIAANGGKDDTGDILSVLLTDSLYKDDIVLILDEAITLFFAATQTLASQISNMVGYLA